jgi:hypothetical protein
MHDGPKRTESGLSDGQFKFKSFTIIGAGNRNGSPRKIADPERTTSAKRDSAKLFRMMVARDGVEPPTPAFSVKINSDYNDFVARVALEVVDSEWWKQQLRVKSAGSKKVVSLVRGAVPGRRYSARASVPIWFPGPVSFISPSSP